MYLEFYRYNDMSLLYDFNVDSVQDIVRRLSANVKQRRLEKGLSRNALSMMSGVPAPTIAKFEQKSVISLLGFIALAKALGYSEEVKQLLDEPKYSTLEELDTINRNKNRKRGRNEYDQ